jgi:hypothetical protein
MGSRIDQRGSAAGACQKVRPEALGRAERVLHTLLPMHIIVMSLGE